MKIAASSIDFASQHQAASKHELQESLRTWIGQTRPDFEGAQRNVATGDTQRGAQITLSAAARLLVEQAQQSRTTVASAPPPPPAAESQAIQDAGDSVENDPHLQLIRGMIEMLTGQKIKVFSAEEARPHDHVQIEAPPAPAAPQQAQPARPAGFGVEYERHESYTESEQMHFQASGVVRTADGQEIAFKLDLNMQRSYHVESHVSLFAGDARKKDPLVINFGGSAAQLQSQRFEFDIDADGSQENIAMLGSNSGFLALDLNGDQKINDGSELFGTTSGNGFADLAKFDADQNGWIDESDAVFNQLRVWTPDAQGGGKLSTLLEKQVGALYLGSQATPFELRDSNNQSLGSVRSSGVYLSENGSSGSLQQIDLSV